MELIQREKQQRYTRRLTFAACRLLHEFGRNPFGQAPEDKRGKRERQDARELALRHLADVIDEGDRDGVP